MRSGMTLSKFMQMHLAATSGEFQAKNLEILTSEIVNQAFKYLGKDCLIFNYKNAFTISNLT